MAYVTGDQYTLKDGRKVNLLDLSDDVVTLIHELEEELTMALLDLQEEKKRKGTGHLQSLQMQSWIFMNSKSLN